MSNYYLRVEAVNLDNSIHDTYNISTIRGGSFMLFEAIKALEKDSSVCSSLAKVSEGASIGLYKLTAASNDKEAKRIKDDVLSFLHKEAPIATFVANYYDFDCEECCGDFSKGVKTLMAKNRWAQWQRPTIVMPEANSSERACTLDGVRPGCHGNGDENISSATLSRRDYGRALRNNLYEIILQDKTIDVKFTKDLEALSSDAQKGNLNGKMAFIYLDGNKFGSIRDKYCTSDTLLNKFDHVVQEELRATILRNILKEVEILDDFKTEFGEIRLETLLWGGDEIEWIVPAWLGWQVLEIFYSTNIAFEVSDKDQQAMAVPLTHACGIIFCNHSAPILQIRKIAHELVDCAKQEITSTPERHREGNFIQYLVLESFDMIEGSLESFTDNYYKDIPFSELLIHGDDISPLKNSFQILHTFFPRNKVFEIVAALKIAVKDARSAGNSVEEILKKVLKGLGDDREIVAQSIEQITKSNQNRWYLIADLWDFFKEVK